MYRHFDFNSSDPLSAFILVVLDWEKEEHPCNVLNRSAGFCKMSCHWDYKTHPKGIKCDVVIDGCVTTLLLLLLTLL